MSGYLPTPPSEGTVPASHATVFLPTPFHPQAEEYAARRFGRLVRAEEGGLTRKQCLEECDAVCESRSRLSAAVGPVLC
jgi:hypothetical protein